MAENQIPSLDAQKRTVLDFIKTQKVGVVCTINAQGLPEAAAMAISQTDELELIFQTPNTTRKYANLQQNKHVAVVFGWSQDNFITVQYEGVAREVIDAAERARCVEIHVAKSPHSKPYAHLEQHKFFVRKPTSIRYSDIPNGMYYTLTF